MITLGLCALHDAGLAYRDLKPENLLVRDNGYLCIADFGFCAPLAECRRQRLGTPMYQAPELMRKQVHGVAVDWWALGCLLLEMSIGASPFHRDEESETEAAVLAHEADGPLPLLPPPPSAAAAAAGIDAEESRSSCDAGRQRAGGRSLVGVVATAAALAVSRARLALRAAAAPGGVRAPGSVGPQGARVVCRLRLGRLPRYDDSRAVGAPATRPEGCRRHAHRADGALPARL